MKFFLTIALFLFCSLNAKSLQVNVRAKSAVLINADTGAVLFEKNPHTPAFPASITKVATALYLLDVKKVDPSRQVKVSAESIRFKPSKKEPLKYPAYWLEPDGTKMGLMRGEEISVEALLHGLMLMSANDAANVLAETSCGSIPTFVDDLNRYLASIGCTHTHFCNPHGLHHPEHMTSAFDMSLIAKKAMSYPQFREIVCKLTYTKPHTNKQPEEVLRQFNHLLRPGRYHYSKAIGIKTGYTSHAQNTLVAAAESEGRTLIAVLLGCEKREDRYIDAKNLFEAAFQESKIHRSFFSANTSFIHTVKGAEKDLNAVLEKDVAIDYFPSEEENPKAIITWAVPHLPIRKGVKVGEMRIIAQNGRILESAPLVAKEDVTGSLMFILQSWMTGLFHYGKPG